MARCTAPVRGSAAAACPACGDRYRGYRSYSSYDAKDLHDRLESLNVSAWFSEKDVLLGSTLLREIDRGLAKSRVGIVLVTPALLRRLAGEGIADKELSALLARDLLVPIVHDTTYEALREISPLLGDLPPLKGNLS